MLKKTKPQQVLSNFFILVYQQKLFLFIRCHSVAITKGSVQPQTSGRTKKKKPTRNQLYFTLKRKERGKKKERKKKCSVSAFSSLTYSPLTSTKLNSSNLHPNPWEHRVLSSHLDCIYFTKKLNLLMNKENSLLSSCHVCMVIF